MYILYYISVHVHIICMYIYIYHIVMICNDSFCTLDPLYYSFADALPHVVNPLMDGAGSLAQVEMTLRSKGLSCTFHALSTVNYATPILQVYLLDVLDHLHVIN